MLAILERFSKFSTNVYLGNKTKQEIFNCREVWNKTSTLA